MNTLYKKYLGIFCLAVAMVFALGMGSAKVGAQSPGAVDGYAWADEIGWISLNCLTGGAGQTNICGVSNYGLNLDAAGNITGYAWSDNWGWIQFNGGCPAGATTFMPNQPCNAYKYGAEVRGFAKITNFFAPTPFCNGNNGQNCGFDPQVGGYISLDNNNDHDFGVVGVQDAAGSSNYGVTFTGNLIGGYGWNQVAGWVQFMGTTPGAVTVTLMPNAGAIEICAANQATLTWDSTNALSCNGSWGATNLPPDGFIEISSPGSYYVTCDGVQSNTVVVTISGGGACPEVTGGATMCEGEEYEVPISWQVGNAMTCTTNWSTETYSTPGTVTVGVIPDDIGDNFYSVTCNGVTSNSALVTLLPDSDPSCSDNDAPVLSSDADLMCKNALEPVNLSYQYDGGVGSVCTASWDATLDLPGTGGSVQVNPSTVGQHTYSVTCDGQQSNEVVITILDSNNPSCNSDVYCLDPDAINGPGSPGAPHLLPCVFGPGSGCEDPAAINYNNTEGDACIYNGIGGKPIIEEF